MGIIRAAINSIEGGLADQWLEVIEPESMSDTTVMTGGVKVRPNDKRNQNRKGTDTTISNGSIIHVYPNQFMMLVDGGKIVDFTAEEGYYKVNNAALPSLLNGQFQDTLMESFNRFRFGGVTPTAQKVYYINLQEVKGIKFGTRNPINYFDNFYNAELFLRAHGSYSIKIVDPLKFFMEAIPRNKSQVEINDINEQYLSEFLTALQAAINQMSGDGIRISLVTSRSMELAKYMSTVLDSDWSQMRGMQIQSVGIASISYDEESKKLINMRNQGAMLQDATIREGYVQGSVARGLEAAGSNSGGAMAGFMGVGMGMQSTGGFMGAASQTNQYQMEQQQKQQQQEREKIATTGGEALKEEWKCSCNHVNAGRFCIECGEAKPKSQNGSWTCKCGKDNTGKFCGNCGQKAPEAPKEYRCNKCGFEPDAANLPKFCPECGDSFNEEDIKK
ncbi:SPFH domain-containing protein [Alkaliphilus peptidifermentans]|uniref:Membrane protease subunit, stomatin/prohibitin family, contains C-terminal Zn-ribbon domain n=1 Tax=Alkaliphilus peptidifermentans DSM 18978 TaxID=1120976 RepID=A0A1G5FYG2_9FIRM|nr:SPFH domain-containing protein [Alkaliphilus peptidifermentans]SCY43910.1 Membrane protease subunit, stomatin/prohibitin family, contains C-terminal Zn-ribbon domain [Alkaliphilus peptidifermentans DSM 18978]